MPEPVEREVNADVEGFRTYTPVERHWQEWRRNVQELSRAGVVGLLIALLAGLAIFGGAHVGDDAARFNNAKDVLTFFLPAVAGALGVALAFYFERGRGDR